MINSARKRSPDFWLSSVYLLIMTLGYTMYAADRSVLASVLALISVSFKMTNYEIGLLGAAQYIGVFCFVFIAGHLSDRYGKTLIIIAGVAVFTVFTWLIGLSSSFLEAFIFRLISGFGEGIFWPVAMAAVAQHFNKSKGLALGIFYVGFDVGSVAGLSLGGLAYSLSGDWRSAFFAAPSLGLVVILAMTALKGKFSAPDQAGGGIRMGSDVLELIKRRNVILILTFALLATWANVWVVVFLPYYFFKVLNFSILSSAIFSSVVAVSGGCGKILLGGISDKWRRNRMLVLISLAVACFYGVFFATTNVVIALVGAVAMGFFSSSIFPIMQALMADSCDGRTGTALGLTTSVQSVATIISPMIGASLFTLGVGQALALDAVIPAALTVVVAFMMTDPRLPRSLG